MRTVLQEWIASAILSMAIADAIRSCGGFLYPRFSRIKDEEKHWP
jgi:hypothetical protein